MFIDIHTHKPAGIRDHVLSVRSFYDHFENASGISCSMGIHPCFTDNAGSLFSDLQKFASLPNVLAIGECGLDKVCNKDLELQTSLFRQQILLANELRKPLIIHCVRAFDELIAIARLTAPLVPMIFHGFNKKGDLADRLVSRGWYLSFGHAILNDNAPAITALANIPADRFFLETDSSDREIEEMYDVAARIRKTTTDDLILQLENNFDRVFKQQ